MKRLFFIFWITAITVLFTACGSGTSTPVTETLVPLEVSSPQASPKLTMSLKPVTKVPEATLVEFLIDNSNSVKRCGNAGMKKYDFVNFLLQIFRTIPEPLSQNLYVGTGSFGNGVDNYKPIIPPMLMSPAFPLAIEPGNTGDAQNFSEAIQLAVDDMNVPQVKKKYLMIITDGKFSSEKDTVFSVQEKVKQVTTNENLFVLVGLICPEEQPLQEDRALWRDKIGGINGAVDIFDGVDEAARYLLEDLRSFIPHSLIGSHGSYQNPLSIAGYYSSANFRYWNDDTAKSTVNVTDTSIGTSWDATESQHTQPIQPIEECARHSLSIPNPGGHWLLFIQAQTFQDLALSVQSANGEPIEVLNSNPVDLHFELQDKSRNHDLRDWKDCFSIDLAEPGGKSLFVTSTHCDDINDLCGDTTFEKIYGQLQWFPLPFNFPTRQDVSIRFNTRDADGPVWEGLFPGGIPVKFMAQYDLDHELPPYGSGNVIQKNFFFRNVAFPSAVDIFLVSRLMDLDNLDCPDPTRTVNNYPAIQFELSTGLTCTDVPEPDGDSICFSYSPQDPLQYQYTLRAPLHVTSTCQYDRLYLLFRESNAGAKAITWKCELGMTKNICSKETEKLDIR